MPTTAAASPAPLTPVDLTCEHLAVACGLNTAVPRFGWALAGDGDDRGQTAFEIVVGHDAADVAAGRGDVWTSGVVASAATRLLPYGGPPLPAEAALHWSVRVHDEAGRVSAFAPPVPLFTGLPHPAWRGAWIARYFVLPAGREVPADTVYDNRWQARPADYLVRDFVAGGDLVRATLYISALGLYEAEINGRRVGDHVMAPGWTDYHRRVEYQVHDVTALVAAGANRIGVVLGEGWYSGRVGHNQRRAGNHYGGRPALVCDLRLHYRDGSSAAVASDADWRTRQGPICYSDFLMGECTDARLARPDWSRPGGGGDGWQPVEVFTPDPRPPLLEAQRVQPAREVATLAARRIARRDDGAAIYDLGQNIAGYVRLDIDGAAAGDRFTLRHAETLDETGALYVANLRHAVATDVYIAAGTGHETFKPHFTFHGFRYVEVTAPAGFDLDRLALAGIAIQTDTPVTGTIETGNALVNRLLSNIFWSQRDNFLSVPTDCPQRDERYGWSADAQVFWRTAAYSMDVAAFLTKWMVDLVDGQSPDGAFPDVAPTKPLNPYRLTPQPGAPAWGDAPIILAWEHYGRYGDADLLARHYDAFAAWMGHIARANPDFLRTRAVYNNYGDWLSVGPASDRAVVATAYWVRIADLMRRIADVLGRRQDAAAYAQTAEAIRAAFVAAYVDADGRILSDTQTVYLLALDFDVVRGSARDAAARHLIARIDAAGGHLQTGFLGVRHLCPVLSDIGAPERAFDLLLKEDYPSWGFSIRHGATTIWERWDGWTPDKGFQSAAMNSFNHYAYGAVGEWIWSRVAGIDWDPAAPGFRSIRLRPLFDRRIGWCRAVHRSPVGPIGSDWRYTGDDGATVAWEVAIPPGATATVDVDALAAAGWRSDDAGIRRRLGSGRHRFTLRSATA
jgi:alpha-L-rhamnosidase